MTDSTAISVFNAIKRKWTFSTFAADLLFASAAGICVGIVFNYFFEISFWWMVPATIVIAAVIIYLDQSWRISHVDIAIYLDKKFPELEESSRLLLQPVNTMTLLQRLQAEKIAQSIRKVERTGKVNTRLFSGIAAAAFAGLIVIFLSFFPSGVHSDASVVNKNGSESASSKTVAHISRMKITVAPPAYTGKPVLSESLPNITALEGSVIKWTIETSSAADSVLLILNDVKSYSFIPSNKDSTLWAFNMPIKRSGYYQVMVQGKSSELYQIQVTGDMPPKITVVSPKPDLLIKYGQSKQFVLQTNITDDYGVKNAYAFATVSSGGGEAVQFRQKRLHFTSGFSAQNTLYDLRLVIGLDSLGMLPGDELYLYVLATDNFNQETRSDVHRIILEDTAQLFSMDGLISGLDIKPEYFRSQRQIIIETEQLLRDKVILTKEEFENKSNSLGIDQKLLRLRYGKFLGEEAVTYGQGDADQHEGEGQDNHQNATASPQDVLSQFGHSHDNAEDATYFDAETKKQLRATLNEMWKAELQLRTFHPKDAMPFELEALRLLKDLQQKSRVYVAKTNSRTTPLKSETRLTGELKEIVSPVFSYANVYKPDQSAPLQKALSILQQLQLTGTYSPGAPAVLNDANKLLSAKAVDEPSKFIGALSAMRNIIKSINGNQTVSSTDISAAQKAIQIMIEIPVAKPVLKQQESSSLSDYYFHQLEKGRN